MGKNKTSKPWMGLQTSIWFSLGGSILFTYSPENHHIPRKLLGLEDDFPLEIWGHAFIFWAVIRSTFRGTD